MTTYDMLYELRPATPRTDRFAGIRRLLMSFWQRRAQQKLATSVSNLDARLLRDIGIEPDDVIEALNGQHQMTILFNPMRRRENHE